MEKRKQLKIFFIVLISIVIAFIIWQASLFRPQIDIETIEFEDITIPDEMNCPNYSSELRHEYEIVNNDRWFEDYVARSDVDIRAFQWIDEDVGHVVHLAIVDYKNPLNAWFNYWALDPKSRKNEHNGPIIDFDNNPSYWFLKEYEVDRESAQKGRFYNDEWHSWYYRALYGQYYLYIEDPGRGCEDYFQDLVTVISNRFAQYIR
jgi:hypothetical protein